MAKSTAITLGTDPELVCVHAKTKELINVAKVVSRMGEFGADGHGMIGELRPKPAVFPRDLVENIRKSLLQGYKVLGENVRWQAGPFLHEKPLGAHIHFGVAPTDAIIDALDHQLAIILALVEPQEQAQRRRITTFVGAGGHVNNNGEPYGLLGDVRDKPYGFEWRVPSSFIVNPGVSLGLFTLAKAVVFEEVEKGRSAWSKLAPSVRRTLRFKKEDFNNCNKTVFMEKLDTLWKIIRKMKYFGPEMEGRNLWANVASLKKSIGPKGFIIPTDIKPKWNVTSAEAAQLTKSIKKLNTPQANRFILRFDVENTNNWVMRADGVVVPAPQVRIQPDRIRTW